MKTMARAMFAATIITTAVFTNALPRSAEATPAPGDLLKRLGEFVSAVYLQPTGHGSARIRIETDLFSPGGEPQVFTVVVTDPSEYPQGSSREILRVHIVIVESRFQGLSTEGRLLDSAHASADVVQSRIRAATAELASFSRWQALPGPPRKNKTVYLVTFDDAAGTRYLKPARETAKFDARNGLLRYVGSPVVPSH